MTSSTTPEPADPAGPTLLVGHRGAGKSTLGQRVAAELHRPFTDLDDAIARRADRPISELLADGIEQFRRIETETLRQLCERDTDAIIACGGGVQSLPTDATVIWLDREDWRDEVRRSDRPRVRPELSVGEEFDWMQRTRPPRWRDAAHLRLPIPRGRSIEDSSRQLRTLLRWIDEAPDSRLANKSWLVPATPAELDRAIVDAERFGFAGVELRSDVFGHSFAIDEATSTIASLRHDEPGWLDDTTADIWDIDAQYADAVAANPPDCRPEKLIVSTHPDTVDPADVNGLIDAAERMQSVFELPPDAVTLKYVALPCDFDELGTFLDIAARLRSLNRETTILTGNRRFAWLRVILAADNATNYLPVGLRERTPEHPSPLDFGDLLPHLAGTAPTRFDALVGDPVDQSRGDMWHRRAALAAGDDELGYLKIPVARGELDDALPVLEQLPIRGVSVTSPLKVEAAESPRVQNPREMPALNTLRRTSSNHTPWVGTDTDEAGMHRALEILGMAADPSHLSPGGKWPERSEGRSGEADNPARAYRTIILGRGGASHAIARAIKNSDAELVAHLSARANWQPEHRELSDIDLIVNAAGGDHEHNQHVPPTRAWLDLHYCNVSAPPSPNPLSSHDHATQTVPTSDFRFPISDPLLLCSSLQFCVQTQRIERKPSDETKGNLNRNSELGNPTKPSSRGEVADWKEAREVDGGNPIHLQGDIFFIAQAKAQRAFWSAPNNQPPITDNQ